jgi:6-phosphofructokinase 1
VRRLEDSFDGLIEPERSRPLTPRDVTGILRLGGTILGTTNRGDPFAYPVSTPKARTITRIASSRCFTRWDSARSSSSAATGRSPLRIDSRRRHSVVGVPKTIDNDIVGTTNCFGFDTAVAFATDAIDRLHTTAEAHHRIMVVEVMGRYTGWIALYSGVAGGADAILIPEIPFDIARVARGSRSAIASAPSSASSSSPRARFRPAARCRSSNRRARARVERLGGIGAQVCEALADATGKETRSVVLGHLQRGGAPTSFDRILATRFGARPSSSRGPVSSARWSPSRRRTSWRALDDVVGRTKMCRWISICWRRRRTWSHVRRLSQG